jgi:hypothetical protein
MKHGYRWETNSRNHRCYSDKQDVPVMSQKLFASFCDCLQSPQIRRPPSLQHRATYDIVQCPVITDQRLNSSYCTFRCGILEQNSSLYKLTIPYCTFTMPTDMSHNATLTYELAEPSCHIPFYCRSTHINSHAQNNLITIANHKYIEISLSHSWFKFFYHISNGKPAVYLLCDSRR